MSMVETLLVPTVDWFQYYFQGQSSCFSDNQQSSSDASFVIKWRRI